MVRFFCVLNSIGYPKSFKAKPPIRVACVGDSVTDAMSGLLNRKGGGYDYPALLAGRLGHGYKVSNLGAKGATVLRRGDNPYWMTDQYLKSSLFAPQVVIIMLGTNDAKPKNWDDGRDFERDLRALVIAYSKIADNSHVYLALPCPIFIHSAIDSQANSQLLETKVIPAIKRVAEDLKIPIIDVHGALRVHPGFFYDGIHPNIMGTEAIATAVYEKLKESGEFK